MKFDLPIPVLPPRLLFSLFASLPPSFFISALFIFFPVVWFGEVKKPKRLHFIFFFSFSCFRLFFTRQCGVENPARLIDLNLGNFVTKQG